MVRTSITIPDDIYLEAKKSSENFSLLVAEALREYLKHKVVEKAKSSFGKWQDRDKSSSDIVKELRKEDKRNYANRID